MDLSDWMTVIAFAGACCWLAALFLLISANTRTDPYAHSGSARERFYGAEYSPYSEQMKTVAKVLLYAGFAGFVVFTVWLNCKGGA